MASADDPLGLRAQFVRQANNPLQRSTYRLESAWSLGASSRSLLVRHGAGDLKLSDKPERLTDEYVKENRAYRYIPQELASDAFLGLQHLNLSRNKLKEVAPRVFQFAHLSTLILAHNEILKLEPAISQLSGLEHLSLAGNYLEQLPAEVYQLTALTHLDVSGNKLRALRPGIRTLSKVRFLASPMLCRSPSRAHSHAAHVPLAGAQRGHCGAGRLSGLLGAAVS